MKDYLKKLYKFKPDKKNEALEKKNDSWNCSIKSDTENLTDNEVKDRFSKLLDEMNLDKDKREPILKKSVLEMRQMLNSTNKVNNDSPSKYVNDLNDIVMNKNMSNDKIISKLESLRICLTNSPVSWVKEFNNDKNNGLKSLRKVLNYYRNNDDGEGIVILCLKCLRAFGNFGYGLLNLINSTEALLQVALCLDSSRIHSMILALELLTLFTFYSKSSHFNVMEALFISSHISGYEERFQPIVEGLKIGIQLKMKDVIMTSLQFINVIVNPNFCDPSEAINLDTPYRSHLRIEFIRCGLNSLLRRIKGCVTNDSINRSVAVFQSDCVEHEEEQLNLIVKSQFQNRDEIYQLLTKSIDKTDCEKFLTSILRHLLILQDNPIRYHLYRLLDGMVAELILRSESQFSPDPSINQMEEYNLQILFEKFKNISCDPNIEEMENKISKLLTEKYENEIKIATLENKLADFESSPEIEAKKTSEIDFNIPQPSTSAVLHPPPPPHAPPPPPPPCPSIMPPPPPGKPNFNKIALPFDMKINLPVKPKDQMKQAFWKKIDTKLLKSDCIWKAIYDQYDNNKFNKEILMVICENFTTNCKNFNSMCDTSSLSSTSSKKNREFKVLDHNTARNLAIMLKSLKVQPEEMKRGILELDESILTVANIESIIQVLPKPDVLFQLAECRDDYENLNVTEQFGYILSSINCLLPRLQNLLFKMEFDEKFIMMETSLVNVLEFFILIQRNVSFRNFLEIVLNIGNLMNSSTKSNQSIGFQMEFLSQLSTIKDNMNDQTLLEYIINHIKLKYPAFFKLGSELSIVDKLSGYSTVNVNNFISNFKNCLNNVKKDLKNYKIQAKNDKYVEIMSNFVESNEHNLEIITKLNKNVSDGYRKLANYLTFDSDKYKLEELVLHIKKFKDDYVNCCKNIERKELESKKQVNQTPLKDRSRKIRLSLAYEEDKSVLDSLLTSLNNGEAYGAIPKKYEKRKKNKTNQFRERNYFQ